VITFSVRDNGFEANLREYARVKRQSIEVGIRQQARLLAVKLAFITKPYGLDRGRSERAIARDVAYAAQDINYLLRKIDFAGSKFGIALEKAMRSGDVNKVRDILRNTKWKDVAISATVDVAKYQQTRTAGKVRKGLSSKEKQIVTGTSTVTKFVKERQKKAGLAKGGWAGAASALGGTRGIPAWVSRWKQYGGAREVLSGNKPTVILQNNVKFLSEILKDSDVRLALSRQKRDFENHLKRVLREKAKV
jgi:hypothetical protein